MGIHSDCVIPDITNNVMSLNSRRQGPGELNRQPALKTRKTNEACRRRLTLRMAALDQRCDEITTRISHDMKIEENKLRQYNADIGKKVLPILPQKEEDLCFSKNSATIRNPLQSESAQFISQGFSSQAKADLHRHSISSHNFQQNPIENVKESSVSESLPKSNVKLTPFNISPASRRRRRRLISRPCDYGTTKQSSHCSHFPCRQPRTYHSLGFRLDDSSTDEWISWSDLQKAKISKVAEETEALLANDSVRKRLLAGSKLKPLDIEFREKFLKEEMEHRRKMNENNKPPAWETNYGQRTPYKRLRHPVRLKPLELTS